MKDAFCYKRVGYNLLNGLDQGENKVKDVRLGDFSPFLFSIFFPSYVGGKGLKRERGDIGILQ